MQFSYTFRAAVDRLAHVCVNIRLPSFFPFQFIVFFFARRLQKTSCILESSWKMSRQKVMSWTRGRLHKRQLNTAKIFFYVFFLLRLQVIDLLCFLFRFSYKGWKKENIFVFVKKSMFSWLSFSFLINLILHSAGFWLIFVEMRKDFFFFFSSSRECG